MPQSKRRRKAAAQQKQQRRKQQALPASERLPDADDFVPRWDEAAEELLTSRSWISFRDLGMDEEGDGWEWMPSQLPLSLVAARAS